MTILYDISASFVTIGIKNDIFFHILVISRVPDLTGLYYALIISYIFDIPLESQFMSSLSI